MGWKKFRLLGRGSYGSVYLAAPASDSFLTGSAVAVKSCYAGVSSSLQVEAKLLQELKNCPYVIQGLGTDISMEDGRTVYNLLLEYAAGGSLDKMIRFYNGNMSETLVASYTYMLLKGLSYIHGKEIVHCDFKPGNVLVFPRKGVSLLKIADFGLSKRAWEPDTGKSRCTPLYASPEAVLCGLNEKSGDIWALGCIAVEMMTGRPLWIFKGLHDLLRKVAHEKPSIPENISEDAKDFLKRCLDRDHSKRWTADMLLNHPFITKNLKLSNAGLHEPQEVVTPKNTWICTIGMFSNPLKVQVPNYQQVNYKAYELFPRGGTCTHPFPLPCGAFGRIC